MSDKSDTPRTDDVAGEPGTEQLVSAEFTRKLERELAAAQVLIGDLEERDPSYTVFRELAETKKQLAAAQEEKDALARKLNGTRLVLKLNGIKIESVNELTAIDAAKGEL